MKRLLTLLLLCLTTASAADKKVVCFVGHRTSHGFGNHEYNAGNHLIGEWLEKAYPGQIESRYSVNWPQDEEAFFKGADSVVIFCSGGGGHLVNGHVENFDKVMRTGAGLACLHYAVEVPIGPSAKGMLDWMGGYFETNWSVNPHWKAKFTVYPEHEAAAGLKPFEIDDEWYFHMRFKGKMEGVTPILSALAPAETMQRGDGPHSGNPDVRKAVAAGEPQHVAWAYQRGKDYNEGRGFGFTGLHYHWNWEEDSFRKTVLNGVAYTLKLPIPKDGVESPRPTKEQLEANALEHGGDQGRKPKAKQKPAPAAAATARRGKAKPLFASKTIDEQTPGHAVEIDIAIPDGSKQLFLAVLDVDGYTADWADWCEPRFVMADGTEKKLTEMKWKSASVGWGTPEIGKNAGGGDLSVAGKAVPYGIGVHANSLLTYDVPAGSKRFKARGGIDNGGSDQASESTVQFLVFNEDPGTLVDSANQAAGGGGGGNATHLPEDAVASLTVHEALEAQLFASEPMLLSPSAIDVDHRGRVWVCEVINYRGHRGKRPEGDRILILEDTDGDAKADKSTVFYQGTDVDSAHGICVLGERVILSAGDDVFSLYDRDGDGKADPGSKELMFTRIGGAQHDHGIHAFHFGPDGRLYFNFGNAGRELHDKDGKLIIDKAGNEVRGGNLPYQEGMVFRCEPDGSGVETLGWNFRNNWEIAVDSFGSVWQSDNDDDGNKGVRINYVMEFGNYGYRDEITRAGWRDPRPNIEKEVPRMHWHLNDPGVVPNLLQTGAGSPTGICVYEGSLLPEIFHGQPIHCDAGPNVVRAYITKPDGAGYSAESLNILEGTGDRWFRPSDVCVAPDGSLIVADWYDPGVGGHGMGDLERGRIFRVAPASAASYRRTITDLSGIDGAIIALGSPNEEARYLAWQKLHQEGKGAAAALGKLFADRNAPAQLRARALWLLARIDQGAATAALRDRDPNIRITALRALRQADPDDLSPATALVDDSNPQVRREVAIALRFTGSPQANQLWARLAAKHEPGDRWGLEALGIGADLHWDARLNIASDLGEELIWRSRASDSAELITQILIKREGDTAKYFRALQFQPDKNAATKAYAAVFLKGSQEASLLAASMLGTATIEDLPGGTARLDSLIGPVRGKPEFVELVSRLDLRGFGRELLDFITANPDASEAVTAANLLLDDRNSLVNALHSKDQLKISALTAALGKTGDRIATGLLANELKSPDTTPATRRAITNALVLSSQGGRELIELAKKNQLADDLKPVAALGLARSPDARIRNEAAQLLPVPKAEGADDLPPIAELAKLQGDAQNGAAAYTKAGCIACHRVRGQHIDFGPDLSEIGNKLSKEALFESILFPSAAISHGFHGVTIEAKDAAPVAGYITSQTDQAITIRLPGGVSQVIQLKDIQSRSDIEQSLMPPGLAATLTTAEFADLVAYLQSLK